MKLIINDKGKLRFNRLLEWLIYMFGYMLVFLLVTSLFDSVNINTDKYYVYVFLTVLIIYILNKTVKPILVTLTIPITGLTLGIFYLFINLFILKIADWIMRPHFEITSLYYAFFMAIILSVMNLLMEGLIIKPIIRRFKKNE